MISLSSLDVLLISLFITSQKDISFSSFHYTCEVHALKILIILPCKLNFITIILLYALLIFAILYLRICDSIMLTLSLRFLFAPLNSTLHSQAVVSYFIYLLYFLASSPLYVVFCTHRTFTFYLSIKSAITILVPVIVPTFKIPTLKVTTSSLLVFFL